MTMPSEDPKENPINFPPDRRFRIWIRPSVMVLFLVLILLPVAVAWIHYLAVGLPEVPVIPQQPPELANDRDGFPAWLRITHYVNFLFIILLLRSGLSILMDHPRLYWNVHCTPGSEWMRFTPVEVPTNRLFTAKDDARYISPWLALPGYRHTIGTARHWHLLCALFWFLNGLAFVVLLFGNDQWKGLVPASWQIVPDAWAVFVHDATFHMPVKPDGYSYNALQQLSYFTAVFVMASLMAVTGLAMSPTIDNRFPWYPKMFGGRQSAAVHSLPAYAGLRRVPSHARNDGGCYRVCPEHEQYRYGDRRRQLDRVVPRPGWHWFGRGYLLSRQLDVLETSPRLAVPRKIYS